MAYIIIQTIYMCIFLWVFNERELIQYREILQHTPKGNFSYN